MDRRHRHILELVARHREMSVNDLADQLRVSKETIRRDLTELENRQLIKKAHGKAQQADGLLIGVDEEGSFQARMKQATQAKARIADAAIQLLKPKDSLFVDMGSTTIFLARALARLEGLVVITNSAMIASLVSQGGGHDIILLGGHYRQSGAETVGAVTLEQIAHYGARYAFLTVGAVTREGVYDYDREEAEIARAMVKASEQLVVLADAGKFTRSAPYKVASMTDIDRLITDKPVPPLHRSAWAGEKTRIQIVK